MVIRQALLKSEIERVRAFLASFDLRFDARIQDTLYAEEDGVLVGTVSRADSLIECLAVDPSWQGENLAGKLVSELLVLMREKGILHQMVYTLSAHAAAFEAMNFRRLADTGKVAILEGGSGSIEEAMEGLKKRIRGKWAEDDPDTAAIVVNCNPITLGHLGLIEYAASRHARLLLFVVEEDLSTFTYKERFSLIHLAVKELENVLVLPSTPYIVSSLTFPGYFLKSMDEKEEEHARLDAILFRDRFLKDLGIAKRYVGTETDLFMVKYNGILKAALGDRLEIVPRFRKEGTTISASIVRRLIFENRIEEALAFVPEATRPLLREIAKGKYEASRG